MKEVMKSFILVLLFTMMSIFSCTIQMYAMFNLGASISIASSSRIGKEKEKIKELKKVLPTNLCIEVDSAELLPIINQIKKNQEYWKTYSCLTKGEKELIQLVDAFELSKKEMCKKYITLLWGNKQKDGNLLHTLPIELIKHICLFIDYSSIFKSVGLSDIQMHNVFTQSRNKKQKSLNPVDLPISTLSYPIYISYSTIMVLMDHGFNWTYENNRKVICSYGTIGCHRFKLTGDCAQALKTMHEIKRYILTGCLHINSGKLYSQKISGDINIISPEYINSLEKLGFQVELNN